MRALSVLACVTLCAGLSLAQVGFKKMGYDTSLFNDSVAVGDFNKDGFPDVAAIDGPHGLLTVYRNTKTGTLTKVAQSTVLTQQNPSQIDTADFDGDGNLDLVIWVAFAQQLEFWRGNGDGTFSFWKDVPTVTGPPSRVYPVDVNGDGAIDIVTLENNDGPSVVEAYVNDTHGNFTPMNGPQLSNVSDMVVGDFNLDGKQDVLIGLTQPQKTLEFYAGNGNGTFTWKARSTTTISGPMRVGSFNKSDATLDVAIQDGITAQKFAVYLNKGNGTFTLGSTLNTSTPVGEFTAGPVNGDASQDLLFAGSNSTGKTGFLEYLLGQGNGKFSSPVKIGAPIAPLGTPVIRDLNLDGRHDVVVPAGGVYVLRNTNASVTCAPPAQGSIAAQICTMVKATRQPQTVRAAGNAPGGIVRMELWVDKKKVYEVWSDQLSHSITLTSSGLHRVTAIAVDRYGKFINSATQGVILP